VRTSFAPTPVLTAPLFDDELVGSDALARLGETVYGGLDVSAVLHNARPLTLDEIEGGYLLRLALPFAAKDDVDLHRRADELHVRVGWMKRTVPLPAAVRRCEVAGARLHDGALEVRFVAPVAVGT
jgi:arsenite-transporting ATPase